MLQWTSSSSKQKTSQPKARLSSVYLLSVMFNDLHMPTHFTLCCIGHHDCWLWWYKEEWKKSLLLVSPLVVFWAASTCGIFCIYLWDAKNWSQIVLHAGKPEHWNSSSLHLAGKQYQMVAYLHRMQKKVGHKLSSALPLMENHKIEVQELEDRVQENKHILGPG